MKKGWKYVKLGEVATYLNGFAFKPSDWGSNGYPIIRIQNLTDSHNSMHRCSREDIPTKYIVDRGDILISWSATLGVFEWLNEKAFLNQHIFKVIFDKQNINKYFFKYAVESSLSEMSKHTNGATMQHIRKGDFDNITIPLPSLKEQEEIVRYLDKAFMKIDAMKEKAEEALEEAKALFQSALTEMMKPKKGWEEKKLGEVADDSADGPFGSNLKKEHYTSNREVRIIQLSNIGEDGWREENTKYTTFEHLKTISRSEVEPGNIVIAKMMPAGRAILCPSHEQKYVLSSDAVKIKLKSGFNTKFILHFINSPYFRKEVYENVTGSGRVRTSLTKLRACHLFLPPLPEQEAIVARLDAISERVKALEENYSKTVEECDAMKQAMLREVFE